jgi:predicted O-methyltransferase YrrM
VGSAALLATRVITTTLALTLVFDVTVVAAFMLTLGTVLRSDRKIERLLRRHDRYVRDDSARAAALGKSLERLDAHVGQAREWVSRDVFTGYQQVEAMIDLRALISPRAPLPALRGWALSPDALRLIMQELFVRRPQLIVECGSGSSSIWLGYAVQQLGTGQVVALEHDERFLNLSRDLVRAHALDDVVEIRYAPLVPWDGGTGPQPWYDTEAIEDLEKIGLLLVDGPPGTLHDAARYPAAPLLLQRCTDHALIVLDDVVRAKENAVSDRWLEEYPELERTVHSAEKGLHVFERAAKPGTA